MKYDSSKHQEFERFKDIQLQQMVLYLLNMEFDMNLFLREG
jgi:hypothetical protein